MDIFENAFKNLNDIIEADSKIKKKIRIVLNQHVLEDYDKAEVHYDEIRADHTDIEKIAKNISKNPKIVSRVKNHIFYMEHDIIYMDVAQKKRLDADPEIVNSWSRMTLGDFVEADMKLFRHEQMESILVSRQGMNQTSAHNKTIALGYDWNPEEAYDGNPGEN